ncbi:MAG: glycosyltransferase [Flavobacteriales bacterium]
MSAKLQILHVASWFPSEVHPSLGNFVERHVEAVATKHGGEVWAPVAVGSGATNVLKMREKNGVEEREVAGQPWTVKRLYHEATRPQLLGMARAVASEAVRMDWKPDVVHLHVAYPAGAASVAWAKKWSVPVVLTEHWTAYHDMKALPWWRRRVVKDVVKGVDVVCPVSADLGEAMQAWVPGVKVRVVPNVVDVQRFKPAELETLAGVVVGASRRKMEGRGVERVLHVSSMNEDQKNISGLLKALEVQLAKRPTWRATLVGGEKASLDGHRAWVKERGLEDRIAFTGPLSGEDVARQMQEHDVLVLNSRRENFPCVIPEAWATGLPVMSTDVGGISEHLAPGLSGRGFLLEAGADVQAWDAAFEAVAESTWEAEAIRDYAVKHFSVEAVADAYDAVYREVLGR